MIDLHCHFLSGIDDGPDTEEESLDLARVWLERGVDRIVATPHVNLRHPNTAEIIEERRLVAIDALERASLNLRVEAGAEVSASVAIDMDDGELGGLTLGDSDWLLIEPPTAATPFALHSSIFGVSGRGWRILLAHPERNPAIQEDLDLLASLVDGGVKTQVTAGSFSGRYGRTAQKTARKMLERDLIHTVSSDAHHATLRPPEMAEPLEQAGYGDMVDWLCTDMPAWILDGGVEPSRPARAGSGRGIFGRFRNRR
jgi:protein-tyrosine phosphatase